MKKFNGIELIKTTKYFSLSSEKLSEVQNVYGYTKEENLIFDDGINVTFFDDMNDLKNEENDFLRWLKNNRFEIKTVLETVNERIAVISIDVW